MSVLLHRGQGRILSGFFEVLLSGEMLVSLCSPFLEALGDEISLSSDWFSLTSDVA